MRIAVGQLWQETNTFNRNPTTLSDFKDWGIATGADVLGKYVRRLVAPYTKAQA